MAHLRILAAPIGGGHMAAAHALSTSLIAGGNSVDIASPATERGAFPGLPKLYDELATRHPLVWATYYYGRQTTLLGRLNGMVTRRRLRTHLIAERQNIDALILLHSLYCHFLGDFTTSPGRIVVVVTDLFGGPREWFLAGADRYIVPTDEVARQATDRGLASSRVLVRRLATSSINRETQDVVTSAFSSPGEHKPRILVVGGAAGVGPIEKVVIGLRASGVPLDITVVCGHNQDLFDAVTKLGMTTNALRSVPDLAAQFRRFDLVITKPGSMTVMELLDSSVPFCLMTGIPGIEAANTRYLTRALQVPLLTRPSVACATIRRFFDTHGRPKGDWHTFVQRHRALRESLPDQVIDSADILE